MFARRTMLSERRSRQDAMYFDDRGLRHLLSLHEVRLYLFIVYCRVVVFVRMTCQRVSGAL